MAKPKPAPMTRTNMYLPDSLMLRMREVAQGRTLAAMVREAVILWLRTQESDASFTVSMPGNPQELLP